MSLFVPDRIVDTIRERGALRTPGLALTFHMSDQKLDATLAPLCAPGGPLICCDVELADKRVKEYRVSTIGGGKLNDVWSPGRPRAAAAPKSDPSFGNAKAVRDALAARFPKEQAKEVRPMKITAIEKLVTVFTAHGPMLLPEIRRHARGMDVTATLSTGFKRKIFAKLGGESRRKTLWGLPGQQRTAQPPVNAHAVQPARPPVYKHKKAGKPAIGEIQDDMPLPKAPSGALRAALAAMGVGQSRLVIGYVGGNIYNTASRVGIKITTRVEGDGIRVWRRE